MENTIENAVVVRQLFQKPHERIADEFKTRVVDMLNSNTRLKRYGAQEVYCGDEETMALQIDEKTELEIRVKVSK